MSELIEIARSLGLFIAGGAVTWYWLSVRRGIERTESNLKAMDEIARQLAPGLENINVIAREIEKRIKEEADDETAA